MAVEQGRLAVGGGGDEDPSGAKLEIGPETGRETKPEATPETKLEAKPETRSKGKRGAKPEADPDAKFAEVKFEEAFARLEVIVRRLEAGDLSLDDSLRLFEEGIALSRVCARRLDEAEAKIELLLQNKDGGLTTVPFENPPGVTGATGEGEQADAG